MFTKTSGNQTSGEAVTQTRRPVSKSAIPSIVSDGVHVTGNLVSDGDLQIDGYVDGDITGRSITIGATGKVTGFIAADDLIVDGIIQGQAKSSKIALNETGVIDGDIVYDTLSISAGGRFEGSCYRTENAPADFSSNSPVAAGQPAGNPAPRTKDPKKARKNDGADSQDFEKLSASAVSGQVSAPKTD